MPARKPKSTAKANGNGAVIGFEEQLWQMADRMRGHMDPGEYKHVALGLIFLKYVSDAFEVARERLAASADADPEDPDEYTAERVFWVPEESRWSAVQAKARTAEIGHLIDGAMAAIEKANPRLRNILPREYGRPGLNKERLGELIDVIGKVELVAAGEAAGGVDAGDGAIAARKAKSLDLLGRVYEYFLAKFASAEGRAGGEFYTPRSIVRLLVEMIEPYHGRVYDPCCGSGGMFVQSEVFIEHHGGRKFDVAIYGQESNHTTWRLAKMNLAIRGIEADLGAENADSFLRDMHPDLRSDYILANPPFNMSFWGGDKPAADVRWKYGAPPLGNANYAWIQHIIHHLSPSGVAGFVLANGSMSSNTGGEGDIRRRIVEADLVDCMIALPPQLFYGTPIPACLWFVTRSKISGAAPIAADETNGRILRDRRGETLFIDCRKLGYLEDRTHRQLSDDEIARIAGTYRAWRAVQSADEYADIPGFCKSATLAEIEANGFILTPGRYVGAEDVEDDGEPFTEKLRRLTAQLESQFAESAKLETEIRKNLATIQNAT